MPLTVGTAGHIDHGKTWLVRALTGKDTDRLPEEQARGISIDLGYAPLELPDGRRLSLVDVPGHERFVRNMVAGATGIDVFLLVIDAAEGARPQTLEHLAVLRLLRIDKGVVAVTKADAVDEETLELALEEARELVPGAPVVGVSAKTGNGLDELRTALAEVARSLKHKHVDERTRLYVDRVFSLRGIGTVATGTLWSGSIGEGDELRAEPAALDVRVRSVQVHDQPVERAQAGQRVAVALPGVERSQLRRGDVLLTPEAFRSSYRLDVVLEALGEIPSRAQLHHGTSQVPARLARVGERYAQLRLASPVVAARDDRFVLRTQTTVGGGRVLDPIPPRHSDLARMELLDHGDIAATVHAPVPRASLEHLLHGNPDRLLQAGEWLFSERWLDELRAELGRRLDGADPLDPGVPPPSEPWAAAVLPLLGLERRGAKLYRQGATGTLGAREKEAARLEEELARGGFAKLEDRELGTFLERAGRLYRVGDGFAVSPDLYERGTAAIRALSPITLARFRDALGVSRRVAQLLLERYDADGLTRRVGDERTLRKAAHT
jgi:selenocysteine-specific elongation factor